MSYPKYYRASLLVAFLVGFVSLAFGQDYFPLLPDATWKYQGSKGAQTVAMKLETDKDGKASWKQEIRNAEGDLVEVLWLSPREEGIYLTKLAHFAEVTLIIEPSKPILYLPKDFQQRKTWADSLPNSKAVLELHFGGKPVKANVVLNWKYQMTVAPQPETIGKWSAVRVDETSVLEILSFKPNTGDAALDRQLEFIVIQAGIPYSAGSVLKWTGKRWLSDGIGIVKSEETGTASSGQQEKRIRTLTTFTKGNGTKAKEGKG